MPNFTWIPFYKELAQKLLAYKDKQNELIDFLEELKTEGIPSIPLNDKDVEDKDIKMDAIDPFTFFATFNRGISDKNRIRILKKVKDKFEIKSEVPTDFSGIPVASNFKSWYFAFKKDRKELDIPTLWQIAEKVINTPNEITDSLFNKGLQILGVSITNLSMGLFWINPERFAACDGVILEYLKKKGFTNPKIKNLNDYLAYIQNIRNFMPGKSFQELSFDAWKESKKVIDAPTPSSSVKYWLYAPGEKAEMWEEFYSKGILGIEVDALGDLTDYPNKSSIVKRLQELKNAVTPSSHKNDATACDELVHKMGIDDVVIVKTKTNVLLGYGIVSSDYFFDAERERYKSCRKVEWKHKGYWEIDHPLAIKTLTDITKYKSEYPGYTLYAERLMAILKGELKSTEKKMTIMKHSLNQILFGPPGTGKTYNSVNQSLTIIDGEIPDDRELATNRFRELIKKGQIVFSTFHQSMCYEDFIEGIKPVEPENEGESISYKVIDGIFKQLAINAEFEYYKEGELKDKKEQKIVLFDDYWNRLIADIESNELTKVKTLSGKFLKIQTVTGQGNVVVKPEQEDALEYIVSYNRTKKLFDAFSDLSKVKNIDKEFRQVIGGSNSTAYWGILNQLKNYDLKIEVTSVIPGFEEKEYSYDQKKELLRSWNGSYKSKSDIKPYILIIDEINRGNVAQIFGELITLLEEDKRLGRTEELRVTLPYSKQKGFGVPSNLYIIGTMNTADRSVEALDTALRRRFTFIEMPPRYDLPELENEIMDGITLEMIMQTLNARIEKLLDKDHLIGHSYFLSVDDLACLKKIFHQNIIPLLQEYFYGDFAKIGLVLGEAFFEKNEASTNNIFAKFSHDATDELNEKSIYRLKQTWAEGEFEKAIEEMVNPKL